MKRDFENSKYNIGYSHILISFFLAISLHVFAVEVEQQRSMYGGENRSKNPEFIAMDNSLIANATRTFGTREHASEGYVERGFDHYARDEFDKSMQRFNEAWLLNQENPYVYLGFALLLNKKKQSCEASNMFKLANEKGLKESGFLADYAYTASQCALLKEDNKRQELFNISNNLYNAAIQTSNQKLLAYVYHSWAKSYYLQKDLLKSQEMIEQSKNLGGTIEPSLIQALRTKKNN
jgi:hypothetical protein